MKQKTRFSTLVLGLLFVFGSVAVCRAQDDDDAGGYVPARVNDANVVAAANFAVRDRSRKTGATIRLIEIKSAKQQVVAGINFELCMEVGSSGQSEESTYFVTAVIYRNLQNVLSLTSWQQSDCGDQ